MPNTQRVFNYLSASGDWISLDELARRLDVQRQDVRTALLILLNRRQAEQQGDQWRISKDLER